MEIYRDEDWEHGMMCGNEECDYIFKDGDVLSGEALGMTEGGTPIEMSVCLDCRDKLVFP